MNRSHRRSHLLIWIILTPLVLVFLSIALYSRLQNKPPRETGTVPRTERQR